MHGTKMPDSRSIRRRITPIWRALAARGRLSDPAPGQIGQADFRSTGSASASCTNTGRGRNMLATASTPARAVSPSGEHSAGWFASANGPAVLPIISREAPPLTSREAKVWRRSWIRTSGSLASFWMLIQKRRISFTGWPGVSPGNSHELPFGTTSRRWRTMAATSAEIGDAVDIPRCLVLAAGWTSCPIPD